MSIVPTTAIEVTSRKIDAIVTLLRPLRGSYWLAFDRVTRCSWVVEAASIQSLPGARAGRQLPAAGVVSVCSPAGTPVFQIEQADILTWETAGERLRIREAGQRPSEIILERLDDLDAPLLTPETVERRRAAGESLTVIEVAPDRLLEVPAALLSTGDETLDAQLTEIERTLAHRRALPGPSHGTAEALAECAQRLDAMLRGANPAVLTWVVALREDVRRAGRTLG